MIRLKMQKFCISLSITHILLLTSNAQTSNYPAPEIKVQQGQSGSVQSVVFSSDGKYLFVAAGDIYTTTDFTLKLWDVASAKEIKSFYGHKDYITSVDCSPDGKYLLSGSLDGIKLWDIETGSIVRSFTGHNGWVKSVKFSPDGKYFLSGGSDKTMKLWEVQGWNAIKTFTGHSADVKTVAFSPDGKLALSGAGTPLETGKDYTIKLWNIETAQEIKTFSGHSNYILSVAFSPDGRTILSGSFDKTMKLWDVESGKEIKTYTGYYLGVSKVNFTPDGKRIMGNNILWDVSTGEKVWEAPSSNNFMAFSPKGEFAVTFGKALTQWDLKTGKQVHDFSGLSATVNAVVLSKDGKNALAMHGDKMKLWDISTGKFSMTYPVDLLAINAAQITPDSKYLLSASGYSFKIRELLNHKALTEIEYKAQTDKGLAISPDGKYALITFYGINCMKLVKIPGGQEIRSYNGHTHSIQSVVFSPDGKYALSGSWDKTLKLWDIATGKEIRTFTGHTSMVFSVAISPDGKFALSGSGSSYESQGQDVKLWEITTGKEIKTFTGHRFNVRSVAFSPDGKFGLSASDDKTIKLWDINAGTLITTFKGHTSLVKSVSFLPDGKRFISGSQDGTIKIWDIETGKWTSFVVNNSGSKWLVFTSDGFWDGSSNCGDLVAMIQGMEVWNIDQFATKNNRPDIILQRLGNTDSLLCTHYFNQYKKRLRRLNIAEEQLSGDYDIPLAKIVRSVQEDKFASLEIQCSDDKHTLKNYTVFVNDVPLFGSYGKPINGNSVNLNEKIELTQGENKIEVSCMNEKGAESYRAFTKVNYTGASPSNLYFIAFGVSKYTNPGLNLRYAAKDALDLENAMLSFKGKGFGNVYTRVLTNEQVTTDAIKSAKDFVKNAKPDDTFILFIAGHGMHDTDAEATYYYLTSNADVNNLKGTAADFETIEDLLQGIPPRNKLFLMDACESGELDDETYENLQGFQNLEGLGIASRGFKKVPDEALEAGTSTSSVPGKRTYLYQKDRYIYNDLVRRSGAIVFSSSKGGELSYERSDIENGLFTEYIMKALTTTEADKDGNGIVSTDELRQYVSEQVAKASGDMQHPTVDRDNISQKFGFGLR